MSNLRNSLQSHLYRYFYCTGGPAPWLPGSVGGSESQDFKELLARTNRSSESWSSGWDVWEAPHHGTVGVAANGLQCRASQSDVAAEKDDAITLGRAVSVRVPAERLKAFPGYYGILGSKDLMNREIVRFYWNLDCDGAPILIRRLSESLNEAGLAHRLKVINNPIGYYRCDAGVLYLHKEDVVGAADSIRSAYRMVRRQLKPQVPALTCRLAPGIGFAESPSGSTSFGLHRCGLIADGLIDSQLRHITSASGRVDAIVERFARQDISLEQPYLNGGSSPHPDVDFLGDIVAQ